ncbi:uncharacterized protein YpiB (UPF0302 family) [Natronocella acetinitrilica]|uniref:Uncharacterized protein YpiB (UPF0302 family) n=1 Tax=Natronocella acetinitrilica TaxID=414046 RepID=A0AAE3G3Q7_9GAMM|nr:hypothetical protein [Natronocella acetinitrilica]MCP1674171.1 uncharacterized protein YpiB (UPF0302 family) [Natronocella acetinitrilica]
MLHRLVDITALSQAEECLRDALAHDESIGRALAEARDQAAADAAIESVAISRLRGELLNARALRRHAKEVVRFHRLDDDARRFHRIALAGLDTDILERAHRGALLGAQARDDLIDVTEEARHHWDYLQDAQNLALETRADMLAEPGNQALANREKRAFNTVVRARQEMNLLLGKRVSLLQRSSYHMGFRAHLRRILVAQCTASWDRLVRAHASATNTAPACNDESAAAPLSRLR